MKPSLVFGIVLFAFCIQSSYCLSIGLKDIIDSARNVTSAILAKVFDLIPTQEEIFQKGKNIVAGYPFKVAFKIINALCSATLSLHKIRPPNTPNTTEMNFVLKYDHIDYLIPLNASEDLWVQEKFRHDWPLVLFATGWTTNYDYSLIDNVALDTLYEAYNCRGRINFVTVDSAAFVDTLYTWSAFNTEAIGEKIADALEVLIETYPIEKIHLIGHSLGAHIVGSAGRFIKERTGKRIPRITGLDPAKPCFNQGETLSGLSRGDATFIDVIHTNPGVLGKSQSTGDIDFYPNGLEALPPGCMTILCAHMRAWEYYAETVYPGNELNFMARRCSSLEKLDSKHCLGAALPMGFAVPTDAKGDYFLRVNKRSPYGKNHRGDNFQRRCKNIKLKPQVTAFDAPPSVFGKLMSPQVCAAVSLQ